jgi:heme/copper-type cytochrome/quinol oxidase subunit 3
MSPRGPELAVDSGAQRAPSAAGVRATPRVGVAGMWAFLATDAMGFGGLFIAYAMLRVRAESWPDPRARLALAPVAAMTFALLLSSLTMTFAARAASARSRSAWLGATAALGAAFLGGALLEYRHLWTAAVPARLGGDLFASTYYLLTGYHALHVLAGLICLTGVWLGRAKPKTLEVVALYWHFVDLAWMPIFTFIYLVPTR